MNTLCHHCQTESDDCVPDYEGLLRCSSCADAETRARWLADKERREAREADFARQDDEWERRRAERSMPLMRMFLKQAD